MRYKYSILARERTYWWAGWAAGELDLYVRWRAAVTENRPLSVFCDVTAFTSRRCIVGFVVNNARKVVKEIADEV